METMTLQRRAKPAAACKVRASVQSYLGGESSWNGTIRFLNDQSLRLEVERRFEKKTLLLIRAEYPRRAPEIVNLIVLVGEVNPLSNGNWELSGVFIRELSPELLGELQA
jgi:hypothetical protein